MTSTAHFDVFLLAYESALARDGHVDLAQFLPEPESPLFGDVLQELIRLDLEVCWQKGKRKLVEDYQREFPAAFREKKGLGAIAFEEYRQRLQAGEQPAREEYERRFGIGTEDWPEATTPERVAEATMVVPPAAILAEASSAAHADLIREVHESDPWVARRLARALTTMPRVGARFLGFNLVGELGRGAFGTVYLAEQEDLAHRHVALKISPNVSAEAETLAQLTHTNIVPVYSVHRSGPFQAVCMPFLGVTTLADVLAVFRGQESLPRSGQGLVSTLAGRKSSTFVDRSRRQSSAPGMPADQGSDPARPIADLPAALAETRAGKCTVILDMLKGLSYVEAVLWIASRLGDGLAHAHERGILHRDLKPANILFTDEGQPMLLDFNLAEDMKLRSRASAALLGGTLPYMSPEHLGCMGGPAAALDARSDLYSLGLILYELLTGRPPFELPEGTANQILGPMIRQRLGPIPSVRQWNPTVSPAVEAIVHRCLAPDPQNRYASARQLQEDLQRQQANLPLKHASEPSLRERAGKWARRHPRLASSTTVAVLAGVLLLVLASAFTYRVHRLRELEALETLDHFRGDATAFQLLLSAQSPDQVQLDEAIAVGRRALDRYQVLADPSWPESRIVASLPEAERGQLRDELGVLALLMSRAVSLQAGTRPDPSRRAMEGESAWELNQLAETCFGPDRAPRALWTQRVELLRHQGREAEAGALVQRANETALRSARDHYLTAREHLARGEFREALPLLKEALAQEPQNVWAWFLLANCHDGLAQDTQAAACYDTCIALSPRSSRLYFNRGLAHLRQKNYPQACADFDRAIALQPDLADAYFNRGLARSGLSKHQEAIADLNRAQELGVPYTRVYFVRARVRERAGDAEGARRDREAGMRAEPTDEKSWLARGIARLAAEPKAALADFEKALELNPRSLAALDNKAHALSERLQRTPEAIKVLDASVSFYPDYVPARASRGVLLARQGRRDDALRDAEESLRRNTHPPTLYQVAGIYALTSRQQAEDVQEAFRLLSSALRHGYGFDLIEKDSDLDPIRNRPEFQRLVEASRALRPSKADR